MEAPLWLLICYGSVGAIDVIYNHLYRYRLYAHASSFTEHISHTFLTLGLTLTVAMLVFVEMGRLGFTIFLSIQVLALLNTLWDVSIEPASRAPLGGLPPQEYFLHTVIFLLHGAFVWAVVANADQLVHGPGFGTLRWPPLPTLMLVEAGALVIIGVVLLGLHLYLLRVGYQAILMHRQSTSVLSSH
jgi:hypothetical protein